jgi:glycine/D-amino acid oxidase-like deaminating enzyme
MKVTRFPSNPGPAAWDAILPARVRFGALEADETTDWLIIGAGFAGLAAARRLSQLCPSDKITVLDALRVGEGPAGRNTGFMIDLPHDLASSDYGGDVNADKSIIARNRAAIAFAQDMVNALGVPPEAFQKVGKINGAASAKGMQHNKEYAAHLQQLGEPSQQLDAQQMQDITGSAYYRGGLFTPGTVMLQPALFVRSVARKLCSNRVKIYEQSKVVALKRSEGLWHAQSEHGSVKAPKVILAVNGHAQSFGHFKKRLVHVFTYGSMTRAFDAENLMGKANWGLTPADPLGSTVRRISDAKGSRLIVRNRFTYEPKMAVNPSKLKRIWKTHDTSFKARFPELDGLKMEHRWGGHLCLSLNNVPAFGEVDDGLFSACCQNGLGTVQGTLGGMMAAEMAVGYCSDMLAELQALDAPKRLPPEPVATLGARARLAWGERQAGVEL